MSMLTIWFKSRCIQLSTLLYYRSPIAPKRYFTFSSSSCSFFHFFHFFISLFLFLTIRHSLSLFPLFHRFPSCNDSLSCHHCLFCHCSPSLAIVSLYAMT